MSNRWVISWLVIDHWRWSMSNRWVIEAPKFCGLSITHRWHRLLIDVIDYSSMTHRLVIDYYTAQDCFLVPFFSFCDFFSCVRGSFSLYLREIPVDNVEAQSANHNSLFNNKTTEHAKTNQSENETNKYADRNRLRGYRFLLVGVCKQSKTASA